MLLCCGTALLFIDNVIAPMYAKRTDLCTIGTKQVRALLHHACPIFEEIKRKQDLWTGHWTARLHQGAEKSATARSRQFTKFKRETNMKLYQVITHPIA